MVDDCHATGFMGPQGRGTPAHFGVEVDILTGTLGKALGGALGGYIAGPQAVIDLLRQRARPYLFSNALPPAVVAAGLAALDLVEAADGLRARLFENTAYWRAGLAAAGFRLQPGEHPIVPVMLGDAVLAQKMAAELFTRGVYVAGFFFPVVPKGQATDPHADECGAGARGSGLCARRLRGGGSGGGGDLMREVLGSVVEAIGETPLVELSRIVAAHGLEGRILAKLDYLQPGFSKKDRAARAIVESARASGALAPGQTVVELTSGNMGTGLAIVCAVLGHPFIAVMSAGNSVERARMMTALGAKVVLVPQAPGGQAGQVSGADLALVEAEAQRLVREGRAFRADQFRHPHNPAAHEQGTGPEFWSQSGGTVTAFCDFVGSGGTLAGVTRALSGHGVRCYGLEPEGAEAIAGGDRSRPDHPVQGGGYNDAELPHLDGLALAGVLAVSDDDARAGARELARREGIFAGFSSGANLAGALRLLAGPERGGTVAIVICDSGLKYLSTDLWSDLP